MMIEKILKMRVENFENLNSLVHLMENESALVPHGSYLIVLERLGLPQPVEIRQIGHSVGPADLADLADRQSRVQVKS